MNYYTLARIAEPPPGADKSAVGTINRPLRLAGVVRLLPSPAPAGRSSSFIAITGYYGGLLLQ